MVMHLLYGRRLHHIVHLGLILLLIGHITTTVLVDRGDASHRITLVKDELVINGGYGFEFTELVATIYKNSLPSISATP